MVPVPRSIDSWELPGLLLGGAVATILGILDDTFQLRARWQLLGQVLLALLAVVAGITVNSINNPFGPGNISLDRAVRGRVHGAVGRRDDQQHQLHRRAGRPVVGDRADRRGDARADHAHVRRRPAVRRRAVLRARRVAAGLPALELPPGVDLHRDQRRDVRGLHARGAVDPGHGEGRRGAARPGRADHRHVLDHRPAPGHGPVAVHPGPGPHPPPAARPRPVAQPDRARDLRPVHRARGDDVRALGHRPAVRVHGPGRAVRAGAVPADPRETADALEAETYEEPPPPYA